MTSTLFPLLSFLMIPLYRGPLSVIVKTFGLVFSHVLPRLPLHLYFKQTTLVTLHRSPVAQSSFVGILIQQVSSDSLVVASATRTLHLLRVPLSDFAPFTRPATTVRILHHTFHTVLCFTLIPRRLQSLSPSFSRLGLHSHCDTFQNQLNPDRCTITSSTRVLVSSLLSPVLKGWHQREIAKYVTDQSANHTDKNTFPFLKNDFRGA